MNTISKYIYSDQIKTRDQKILAEKRRRHQIYLLLDYTISNISYFDFFSSDAFNLITNSRYLAQSLNQKNLFPELLLIPFLEFDLQISNLLKEFSITEEEVGLFISSLNKFQQKSLNEQKNYFLYKMLRKFLNFSFFENVFFNFEVRNSYELNLLFEKSAENSLTRFKTPVITPEILFITMMEEKHTKVGKIIQKFLKTDTNWYLLRYKLIKMIHYQETDIRTNVNKNDHYFAYLLKLNISEAEFNRLIETESLHLGVSVFRNNLITKLLKVDLFENLDNEIHKSIKINNTRKYSS